MQFITSLVSSAFSIRPFTSLNPFKSKTVDKVEEKKKEIFPVITMLQPYHCNVLEAIQGKISHIDEKCIGPNQYSHSYLKKLSLVGGKRASLVLLAAAIKVAQDSSNAFCLAKLVNVIGTLLWKIGVCHKSYSKYTKFSRFEDNFPSEAWFSYTKGKYEEAQNIFNKNQNPTRYQKYLTAKIWEKVGNTNEAKQRFCSLLTESPKYLLTRYPKMNLLPEAVALHLGDMAYDSGDSNEATLYYLYAYEVAENVETKKFYKRAAAISSLPHLETMNLAFTAFAQGDFCEALTHFEEILIKSPEHYVALLGKTQCLLRLRNYESALRNLEVFMQSGLLTLQAEKLRAEIYLMSNQLMKAAAAFNSILRKNPGDIDASLGLMETQFLIDGAKPETLESPKKFYKPEQLMLETRALVLHGIYLMHKGEKIKKGEKLLNECIFSHKHSSSNVALSYLGQICYERKENIVADINLNHCSAFDCYEAAIESGFHYARLKRLPVLEKFKRDDLIQEDYDIIKQMDEFPPGNLLERSRFHKKFGNLKEAEQDALAYIDYLKKGKGFNSERKKEISTAKIFLNDLFPKKEKQDSKGKAEAVPEIFESQNETQPEVYSAVDLDGKPLNREARKAAYLEAKQKKMTEQKNRSKWIEEDRFILEKQCDEEIWFKENQKAPEIGTVNYFGPTKKNWKNYCLELIRKEEVGLTTNKKDKAQSIYKPQIHVAGSSRSVARAPSDFFILNDQQRVFLSKAKFSWQNIEDLFLRVKRKEYDYLKKSTQEKLVHNALLYNLFRFFEALKQAKCKQFYSLEQAIFFRDTIRHRFYLIDEKALFVFLKKLKMLDPKESLNAWLDGKNNRNSAFNMSDLQIIELSDKYDQTPDEILKSISKELDAITDFAKPIFKSENHFYTLSSEGDFQHALKMSIEIIGKCLRKWIDKKMPVKLLTKHKIFHELIRQSNKVAHVIGNDSSFEIDEIDPTDILKVCEEAKEMNETVRKLMDQELN